MVKCNTVEPKSAIQTEDLLRQAISKQSFKLDSSARLCFDGSGEQNNRGFHLQGSISEGYKDNDSVLSGSLIYKQRIDAMFDETRSLMSGFGKVQTTHPVLKRATSLFEGNQNYNDDYNGIARITNNVQVKIEKMFADISSSSEQAGDVPSKGVSSCNQYPVDYLGSIPLQDKVNSLEGLQEPLKKLYFSYKQSGKRYPVLQGCLEISSSGLKVSHIEGKGKAVLEQLNPFPTIAVWAAVKFVCRPRGLGHGKEFGLEYAFLPLIADPVCADKVTFFRRLNNNEALHFRDESYDDQSPLFAVVMRKIGTPHQQECHGFICSSTEHAIVMAADLYKALVISMAQTNEIKKAIGKRNKLEYKNGLSTVRSGGSSVAGESEYILPPAYNIMLNKANLTRKLSCERLIKTKVPPVRPPRRSKPRSSSITSNSSDCNIYTRKADKNIYYPKYLMQHKDSELCTITSESASDSKETLERNYSDQTTRSKGASSNTYCKTNANYLQRSVSERLQCIQPVTDTKEVGDILTKVAIPRSRSFLNAGGPLSSRYNRHYSNDNAADIRKKSVGSPLGLNELFTEFRLHEGLNNMDDILEAIIDEEGMSFNDLKPIYKEFLLKLAVTLTKDELYQHSKSIMQRQKNRKQQMLRRKSSKLKKTFTANGGLKRVFHKSVSKLKTSKNKASSFEFTSILFPSCGNFRGKQIRSSNKNSEFIYNTSSRASSFLVAKSKPKNSILSRQSSLKRTDRRRCYNLINIQVGGGIKRSSKNVNGRMLSKQNNTSASEDSDFFSLNQCAMTEKGNETNSKTQENSNHQTSSGFLSCSECSYNSESCTCTSADMCYCSLGKGKKSEKNNAPCHSGESNKMNDASLSSCGCDTDSCFESEKCYCNKNKHTSIFDQLKQQGFVASESSLSRANSPTTAWHNNELLINESTQRCSKRDKDSLQSSKSLEFLQIRRHPDKTQGPHWNPNPDSVRIPTRMDVYEMVPRHQQQCRSSFSYTSEYTPNHPSAHIRTIQKRSYSSDNLALDYDMFTNNAKSDEESQQYLQRKVLVVSARDPRGRVIYMGATCRSCSPMQYGKIPSVAGHHRQNSAIADEAFSVKKAAEIAALFSDVKPEQNTNLICNYGKDEVIYNTLEPPDYYLMKGRIGSSCYLQSTNLENSLGYFP